MYVADVGSNLIHRKQLLPDGITYRGERVDQETEFVRSRDIWFRPVQLAIGPEGGLYVADMYRETIEHPASLPLQLKRQLDLTSAGRGRIYRIVTSVYKYTKPVSLVDATTEQLVNTLDHANMWQRTTALRLLYERHDVAAVDLLRAKVTAIKWPEGRVAVLHALAGLKSLRSQDLIGPLSDPHPQVRRHALRLAEPLLSSSPELVDKVLTLVDDTESVVQFQLALTLGECSDARMGPALAAIIIRNQAERDIVDAAMTSVSACASPVLQALVDDRKWLANPRATDVLTAIVEQIVRQRRDEDISALTESLDSTKTSGNSVAVTRLLKVLSRIPAEALASNSSPQFAKLRELKESAAAAAVKDAETILGRPDATHEQRLSAIGDLALASFDPERPLLERLLSPQEPPAIRQAVLVTLANFDAPQVGELVLSRWHELAPAERSQATDLLLRRESWALQLVQHLQRQGAALGALDPAHVARLQNFPSDSVRKVVQRMSADAIPN